MGYDYALVHVKYTIPLAALLTLISYPLFTRLDVVRTLFIVTIAFVATIPWDSYLIRTGIWSYPPDAVLGPTLYDIPIEELFFFIIQTYITAQLYIVLNKPVLHAKYLNSPTTVPQWIKHGKIVGQVALAASVGLGAYLIAKEGEGTYMGLILVWACTFALFTWTITAHLLLALPLACIALPIIAPTVYLWVVDELALGRGTWAIESGTKLEFKLFGDLEIEEATFFLVTNMLIVFGVAAFDKAVAVCDAFPDKFDEPADALSMSLLRARVLPSSKYDMRRIFGLREADARLAKKSRSFRLASSVFPSRLRIDLTLLYSYCRLADDLVDDAKTSEEARVWISKLDRHLSLLYKDPDSTSAPLASQYAAENFPASALSALDMLPSSKIPREPLAELLKGFEMDLEFSSKTFPIATPEDLELYAARVASTVGQACLELVFHHCDHTLPAYMQAYLRNTARQMGLALQFVNIARDISVDAKIGRVYLPTSWLKDEGLTPEDILKDPTTQGAANVRRRVLNKAFEHYAEARESMKWIPSEARGPMVVAVESYMEIGRVLVRKGSASAADGTGRATVPKSRRIWVAWSTLMTA
ncbi:Bifunctional lycopene cyclase/phytoene synthase [Colletotrichum orbiculare MAFF 240422]|uniref:Bifunctional lycopene cyclase/phytoene synthase n=1 Tax=Colletotrichum orbiculare (strain 104-T / ATCC 96160 / CBS 514.97 / LARS 414 / MAFF 240422) TaxID=1213857 RepID=N4VSK2_COLOR|nr:Bifunctional lycopene cyclase/phytoene synthase [Colletotrichum orbiculare MAFF 240422]